MKIIDVNKSNVERTGFFCYMSRRKSVGFQRKLAWLKARFDEGLRIKMLDLSEGGRGFIEYIPGEYAWRSVNADEYMVIHCLWVVGKSRRKGYAALLLQECENDARHKNLKGVAMVASERNWLAGSDFFLKHGYKSVDYAPPSFSLLVKSFGKHAVPAFTGNWEEKTKICGSGITLFRSDQCPYTERSGSPIRDRNAANRCDISSR